MEWTGQIDNLYFEKYWDTLHSVNDKYILKIEKLNENFILPITPQDIENTLDKVPQEYLVDLKGILLLSGSNKQLKTSWSNLYRFGTYSYKTIFEFRRSYPES